MRLQLDSEGIGLLTLHTRYEIRFHAQANIGHRQLECILEKFLDPVACDVLKRLIVHIQILARGNEDAFDARALM